MVTKISITLDNWVADVIDKIAKESDKNRSELINELLIKQLTKFEEGTKMRHEGVKGVKGVKAF